MCSVVLILLISTILYDGVFDLIAKEDSLVFLIIGIEQQEKTSQHYSYTGENHKTCVNR